MKTEKPSKKRIVSICKQLLNARETQKKADLYNTLFDYCDRCGIDFANALSGGTRIAKKSIACQSLGIQEV